MAGLVSYESSDEDEVIEAPGEQKQNGDEREEALKETIEEAPQAPPPSEPEPAPFVGPTVPQNYTNDLPDLPDPSPEPEQAPAPPGSPHTSHRALLRNLTLPTHPNLDLPPSPPGSPPPPLTSKITTFLSLKEKGTHFNAKLQSSPALRNPALTDKLLAFAGVEGEQYGTTIDAGLWDPRAFPEWAYRGGLRSAKEGLRKEREGERRETGKVEFVTSSSGGLPTNEGSGGLSKRRKLE